MILDKILPIEANQVLAESNLPETFHLLVSSSRIDEMNQFEKYYQIDKVGYFDLNRTQDGQIGYRNRLKVDYFVLTLKTRLSLR